jgi:glycosyltransferase involved in cell wall biosynthesis
VLHRALGSFDRVRRFLAVSEFVRAKHIEAGFPPERITVKPNFCWPVPRREGPGEYFLYLGRLSPEKGLPMLLKAWRDSPARLLVAGGGPLMASLLRQTPHNVDMLGDVPSEDVGGLLAGARALLVPSRAYEGGPRAVLEAYAAGVPVLASRLGSLTEVVHDGVSGLLLDHREPREWRAATDRLLDDDEAERLGEGAWRTWRARYGPERGLRALETAYREAMGAG